MAMAARPPTPVLDAYGSYNANPYIDMPLDADPPTPAAAATQHHHHQYHTNQQQQQQHHHYQYQPRFHEDFDAASQRGSLVLEGPSAVQSVAAASVPPGLVQRSLSQMSLSRSATPTRSSTLKKRTSLSKRGSMRRSGSRKSLRAGSVRSLNLGDRDRYGAGADGVDDVNSAFAVPIPTDSNPTEVLAGRFQGTFLSFFFFFFPPPVMMGV